MSLTYFAQSVYLCAKCGANLAFVSGKKDDENLSIVMKCPNPKCVQCAKDMKITLVPLHAPPAPAPSPLII